MGFLYTICRRILAPDVLKAAYGLTEPMTEHILYWKKPAYFWIEGCLVWNG
jgi:hypothetical protein